ncbi:MULTISPECIES: hypothetical protein [unclassified Cupriavidus]|uniref:hypothetical protein n=1 Tax=unclassified Cupriavidus TaxID=2640874 RepID=UPI0034143978
MSPASQFQSANADIPAQTLWRAQVSASYEVDLFGRVSDSIKASNADADRSSAVFRSLMLALQPARTVAGTDGPAMFGRTIRSGRTERMEFSVYRL